GFDRRRRRNARIQGERSGEPERHGEGRAREDPRDPRDSGARRRDCRLCAGCAGLSAADCGRPQQCTSRHRRAHVDAPDPRRRLHEVHGPQDARRGSHATTTHSMGRPPPEADVMTAGEFFGEVGSIAGRWIKKTLRRPPFLFFSLVQPIVWFVLFTAAFAKIADIPGFASTTGTTSYLTFFSGAVIIQTVLASAMQS